MIALVPKALAYTSPGPTSGVPHEPHEETMDDLMPAPWPRAPGLSGHAVFPSLSRPYEQVMIAAPSI